MRKQYTFILSLLFVLSSISIYAREVDAVPDLENAGFKNPFVEMTKAGGYHNSSSINDISINEANEDPTFTSNAVIQVNQGETYTYVVTTEDPNNDQVTITATEKPDWLSLPNQVSGQVTTLAGSGAWGSADGNGTSASFRDPTGVAIDGNGNVYVADASNNKIRKIDTNGEVTTWAGSGVAGSADGNRTSASFNTPYRVAVDANGNVYVADYSNHKIRKIDTNGEVTTLAGSGIAGSTDGNGTNASFNGPYGVAVDGNGNVYVVDYVNYKIRKIDTYGNVTTLAGSGNKGSSDGNGTSASFSDPVGLAIDRNGNVYVADVSIHKIRKIDTNGEVTTLAGSGVAGSADGNGTSASFNFPAGVATDSNGNVYVADLSNSKIRKIDSNGNVTTLAGSGVTGSTDGNGTEASFNGPQGVAIDENGNLYVADSGNQKIRKIASTYLTGKAPDTPGNYEVTLTADDGNGGTATQAFTIEVLSTTDPRFTSTAVTEVNEGENYTYEVTTEDPNNDLVTITTTQKPDWLNVTHPASGQVTTLAGSGASGSTDDNGTSAGFYYPFGVAADGDGNVYVADTYNHKIRKIDTDGYVTTLAGSGVAGSTDDNGTNASFNNPQGVAVDGNGNVYVADLSNHKIRKIDTNGNVTTLAGSGVEGSADGNGTSASFNGPHGVATDENGNLYVADTYNNNIRRIDINGEVTTLAGSGVAGSAEGNGTSASFNRPHGVSADGNGNIYVADFFNDKIRKIDTNGNVTTLAGSGVFGSADGNATSASFRHPTGMAVDENGNLFISDYNNHKIRVIDSNGEVTTVAGSGIAGSADGNGTSASFNFPAGVATDGNGNLYVADRDNNKIRKIAITYLTSLTGDAPDTPGSHEVTLTADDGNGGTATQTFTINVLDTKDPVFTSATSVNFKENSTSTAYTATATDASSLTYSLGSGKDEALFDIDGSSGTVIFKTSPDFETPLDGDSDNAYVINVVASDGTNSANQDVTITVTDVDDTDPVFTSGTAVAFEENGTGTVYTAVATDASTLTYSLGSGKDEALFDIDGSSGGVTFRSAPDFETPLDGDSDNVYVINVMASDGTNSANQDVTITVTDVDDTDPVFTSGTAVAFEENGTGTVYTAIATDASTLTYSLGSGKDEDLFDIDGSSGAVTFKSSPDFESPADGDADNAYVINIVASDGTNSANQDITITVTDVDDDLLSFDPTDNLLKIYPNPVTDKLSVLGKVSIKSIRIVDQQGRMILVVTPEEHNQTNITLSEIPAGVYILFIETMEGSTIKEKIIKN